MVKNNIILIVSKSELNYILSNKFDLLSNRLKGIILGLLESNKVKNFALTTSEDQYSPIKDELLINNFISQFLDSVDIYLRKYYAQDPFVNFNIKKLKKKCLGLFDKNSKIFKKKINCFNLIISSSYLKNPEKLIKNFPINYYLEIHYTDLSKFNYQKCSFFEIKYRVNSGITITILNLRKLKNEILCKARISSYMNLKFNIINVSYRTSSILQVALNKFNYSSFIDSELNNTIMNYSIEKLKSPKYIDFILLSIRNLSITFSYQPERLLRKLLSFIINPYHRWNICITSKKNKLYKNWQHLRISKKRNFFNDWVADPFIFDDKNEKFIIYEKFIFKDGKGSIFSRQLKKINGNYTFGNEFKILENNLHLSYPFTFKRNNYNYFIPENSNNGANLYVLQPISNSKNKTFKARKIKKLLNGYSIDPTLIRVENIDYLFVSGVQNKFSDVLYIYFSSDITKYPLKEHPCSPLLVDHTLGRSAGRIFWDNSLRKYIRPSQICSDIYGEGIAFSTIKITKTNIEFVEIDFKLLSKRKSSKYSRFHHLEIHENFIAMDYAIRRNELLTLKKY